MSADNGRPNGLYSYDSFTGNSVKKKEKHFLWWCAGAHQELLKDYPSEHAKYAGLGGAILATFALATLASGYAMYSVFQNSGWAIAFALLWGLIIFNFDRFLVSTMRKYGLSREKQLWHALPRIILALLIGITIARPLEMKIFEKEIDAKVEVNLHKKLLLQDSLLRVEKSTAIAEAMRERSLFTERKQSIEDTIYRLQQAYVQEADGTGGSKQRGIDKLTRLKQEAYQAALLQFGPEIRLLGEKIGYQDSILNSNKATLDSRHNDNEAALHTRIGFLERNKALSDLASEEPSIFWAELFLSLLIILIETGPILSKLIMSVGPYDLALAQSELIQMAASESAMSRDKQSRMDKQDAANRNRKETSDTLMEKLKTAQQRHIHDAFDKWDRDRAGKDNRNDSIDQLLKNIREKIDYEEDDLI